MILDGAQISAGPEKAMVSDNICVLIGCSVLVCLRQVPGTEQWNLVGECYVNDYMDEKVIEEREIGNIVPREYLLIWNQIGRNAL
jgi:hypothetical protein